MNEMPSIIIGEGSEDDVLLYYCIEFSWGKFGIVLSLIPIHLTSEALIRFADVALPDCPGDVIVRALFIRLE